MKEIFNYNYKIVIFSICLILFLTYPMPYYISSGGGISNLNSKFKVEGGYESKGTFNLSYVTQLDANVSSYLLSYVVPDWEREKAEDYQYVATESIEDINNRGVLQLNKANQNSVILAYTKAGKEINIKSKEYYIALITNDKINKIKIGDLLVSINDVVVNDINDFREVLNTNDVVSIKVLRDDKYIEEDVNVIIRDDGVREVGLGFFELYNYEVNPKIEFSFDLNESGSSAGLMTTLAIYNSLVEEDLTHGLTIAGTGTIALDGTVGEIGGVTYKLRGAVYGKADIFFVPSGDNYDEALALKNEKNYDIKLVKIDTLDDAINYLENLGI